MARRRNIFAPSESLIQAAVIAHWKLLGVPGSLVAAIPNANAHGQPGLTPGLPDLLVWSPHLGPLTGFIELKTDRGRLSAAQRAMRDLSRMHGVPYVVTHGRDQPIEILELWGVVRQQISQINSPEQGEAPHGRAWSGEAKLGGAQRGAAKQGKDIAA